MALEPVNNVLTTERNPVNVTSDYIQRLLDGSSHTLYRLELFIPELDKLFKHKKEIRIIDIKSKQRVEIIILLSGRDLYG